jgi:hypothetical protein
LLSQLSDSNRKNEELTSELKRLKTSLNEINTHRLEQEDNSLKSKIQKDQLLNQLAKQNLKTIGRFELDNTSVVSSYLDDKDLNGSEVNSEDNGGGKKTPPKRLLS